MNLRSRCLNNSTDIIKNDYINKQRKMVLYKIMLKDPVNKIERNIKVRFNFNKRKTSFITYFT